MIEYCINLVSMSIMLVGTEPIDNTELAGELLTVEDFQNLNLPEILPPYEGKGSTSFAEYDKKTDPNNWIDYDTQKREYLNTLGIETPTTWLDKDGRVAKDNRALLVSMFIITGHILAMEDIRRSCGGDEEVFEAILNDANQQILNHRLDIDGMRRKLPDGTMKETHYEKLKLSANPEKRASLEELHMVTRYILEQLKGDR